MNLLLKDILEIAETRFKNESCLTPRLDAEMLFCHMVGKDKAWLFLHYGDMLDDKTCDEYFELVDRRAEGMPLQYITGHQEFMGLDFKVNNNVLIPRQDTEILVEKALEILKDKKPRIKAWQVMDLCCGSGAIAVSLAHYLRKEKIKAAITATDISADAILVAKTNARANSVGSEIRFLNGDLFAPLFLNRKGRGKIQFDLIVSNPPYISTEALPTLMREIREHEPMIALDGGEGGLDFYLRILKGAHLHLAKSGSLLLEIGHDQGEALILLAEAAGVYGNVEIIKDYSGNDRAVLMKLSDTCFQRYNSDEV